MLFTKRNLVIGGVSAAGGGLLVSLVVAVVHFSHLHKPHILHKAAAKEVTGSLYTTRFTFDQRNEGCLEVYGQPADNNYAFTSVPCTAEVVSLLPDRYKSLVTEIVPTAPAIQPTSEMIRKAVLDQDPYSSRYEVDPRTGFCKQAAGSPLDANFTLTHVDCSPQFLAYVSAEDRARARTILKRDPSIKLAS